MTAQVQAALPHLQPALVDARDQVGIGKRLPIQGRRWATTSNSRIRIRIPREGWRHLLIGREDDTTKGLDGRRRSIRGITCIAVEQRNVLKERVGLKDRRDGVGHVEHRQPGLARRRRRRHVVCPWRLVLSGRWLLLRLLLPPAVDIGATIVGATIVGGQIEAKLEHCSLFMLPQSYSLVQSTVAHHFDEGKSPRKQEMSGYAVAVGS